MIRSFWTCWLSTVLKKRKGACMGEIVSLSETGVPDEDEAGVLALALESVAESCTKTKRITNRQKSQRAIQRATSGKNERIIFKKHQISNTAPNVCDEDPVGVHAPCSRHRSWSKPLHDGHSRAPSLASGTGEWFVHVDFGNLQLSVRRGTCRTRSLQRARREPSTLGSMGNISQRQTVGNGSRGLLR